MGKSKKSFQSPRRLRPKPIPSRIPDAEPAPQTTGQESADCPEHTQAVKRDGSDEKDAPDAPKEVEQERQRLVDWAYRMLASAADQFDPAELQSVAPFTVVRDGVAVWDPPIDTLVSTEDPAEWQPAKLSRLFIPEGGGDVEMSGVSDSDRATADIEMVDVQDDSRATSQGVGPHTRDEDQRPLRQNTDNVANTMFATAFPKGHWPIEVSGDGLLCGVRALIKSARAQLRFSGSITQAQLLVAIRSERDSGENRQLGPLALTNNNNFSVDQIGAGFTRWARERQQPLNVQVGYILADGRAFLVPVDDGLEDLQTIWIATSSSTGVSEDIDHYSGLTPRPPPPPPLHTTKPQRPTSKQRRASPEKAPQDSQPATPRATGPPSPALGVKTRSGRQLERKRGQDEEVKDSDGSSTQDDVQGISRGGRSRARKRARVDSSNGPDDDFQPSGRQSSR